MDSQSLADPFGYVEFVVGLILKNNPDKYFSLQSTTDTALFHMLDSDTNILSIVPLLRSGNKKDTDFICDYTMGHLQSSKKLFYIVSKPNLVFYEQNPQLIDLFSKEKYLTLIEHRTASC